MNISDMTNIGDIKNKNNINHLKNLGSKISKLDDKEEEQLRKLSKDFESIFLKQLLDVSMKDSTFAGEGAGKDIIMGMYTDAISQSGSGNFGFGDMMYDYLKQQSNTKQMNMKAKLAMEENK